MSNTKGLIPAPQSVTPSLVGIDLIVTRILLVTGIQAGDTVTFRRIIFFD